ncbi:hypothetical protein LZ31DRAFT_344775 [Colletotrichum somersetense]|nr:hypothetical protein LZ31DRAFT_344775 [Colletotrichum somersetense]
MFPTGIFAVRPGGHQGTAGDSNGRRMNPSQGHCIFGRFGMSLNCPLCFILFLQQELWTELLALDCGKMVSRNGWTSPVMRRNVFDCLPWCGLIRDVTATHCQVRHDDLVVVSFCIHIVHSNCCDRLYT